MTFECKTYCQYCVICNRVEPDRRGGASLKPLGISEYPWEIVGIDYVTERGTYGYTYGFIMFCHLTKRAHFFPCHKEITAEDPADLFISNCYK